MLETKKDTIAFFLPSLEGGGAERNVINFAKHLNKEKYQITLILAERKGVFWDKLPEDIVIEDLGGIFVFNVFVKMIKYFRKETPDIFISTFPRFNFVNMLAKIFSRKKFNFIIIEQTTPSKLFITARKISHKIIAYFFLPFLIRFFYSKAKAIVCVSEAVKDDLCRFAGLTEKINVIYNPVIGEKIEYQWFESKKTPVILSMGRLVSAKDYPTLIGAFSFLLAKKEVRLMILGEGEEKENIREIAKDLGVLEKIDFLGFQENPYKYLAGASVFVSSSVREGFSNSIVEAMACGTPVVSTEAEGPAEIIENGKNGVLVPVGDSKALAEAILEVLNNPVLQQKLSTAGRIRAQDFTIKKSIEKYEELFNE